MDYNCIIIRWGELGLKGKNRYKFEDALIKDLVCTIFSSSLNKDEILEKNSIRKLFRKSRSKLYFDLGEFLENYDDKKDDFSQNDIKDELIDIFKSVYGISSFSLAIKATANEESIKLALDILVKEKDFGTYRVSTKRSTKDFYLKSDESNRFFGEYIYEKYNKPVSLKNYDANFLIEIDNEAYVSVDKIVCEDGLPLGVSGRIEIICFNDDIKNQESHKIFIENVVICSKQLMKRGCFVRVIIENKECEIADSFIEDLNVELSKYKLNKKIYIDTQEIVEYINEEHIIALPYELDQILMKEGKYFEIRNKIDCFTVLFPLV